MIDDEIEFVDRDYEGCIQENAPRQIKTRKLSFRAILDKFTRFRIERLQKKLDRKMDDALTSKYTQENSQKKLEKKATAIAKLEEKIMLLSREDVPEDYVSRRAIKLRSKMGANLKYNSGKYYSIGLESKDEIFASDDDSLDSLDAELRSEELSFEDRAVRDEVSQRVSEIMDEKEEQAPPVVSTDDVRDAVNEAFAEVSRNEVFEVNDASLSSEMDSIGHDGDVSELHDDSEIGEGSLTGQEVRDAIEESFREVEREESPKVGDTSVVIDEPEENIDVSRTISRDAVRDAIDAAFNELDEKEASIASQNTSDVQRDPFTTSSRESEEVSHENAPVTEVSSTGEESSPAVLDSRESKQEIVDAINDVINRIKVSRSHSAVRFDRFGEDGSVREKSQYSPMTDEEIRLSQEKIDSVPVATPPSTHTEEVSREESPVVEESSKYVYTPMTDEEIRASQEKIDSIPVATPPSTHTGEESFVSREEIPIVEEKSKYVYTPMTDEEIRESQIKLGFDEHGNLINAPIRDDVVVAPERSDDVGVYVEESTFIPSDKDLEVESTSSKIDDYNELKAKILYLQKQQALTQQKKAQAKRDAEEAAKKALEAKQEFEESQRSVSERMEMLKAYTEALEKDCHINERTAEIAENDARMNLNFIDTQKEKVEHNNRLIDEIDSLIGPTADSSSDDYGKDDSDMNMRR